MKTAPQHLRFEDLQTLYFIGIGGIGMSALARYFHRMGKTIYGYDKTRTPLTDALLAEGMHVHFTDSVAELPPAIDLAIYTPAIPATHQGLQYVQQSDIPLLKRSAVLGLISRQQKTIAVAGTHGKTTTSSILTHILHTGGISCTAFLGGIANNFNSNYIAGDSEWVVVEADEYDRSFLQLTPDIAIINSLDADHLDIYGDRAQMLASYAQFANQLKDDGILYIHTDLVTEFVPLLRENLHYETFGTNYGNFYAKNLRTQKGFIIFDLEKKGVLISSLQFTLPGKHNVENATVASAVALQLGITTTAIQTALASFKGIHRRFDTVVAHDNIVYIDDYAHHPTELQAAIATARMLYPQQRLTVIFQPHLFSRTRDFADGFAAALAAADEVILLDIYPARELPIAGITSQWLLEKMPAGDKKLWQKEEVVQRLQTHPLQVLMTLGAGDIDTLVNPLKTMLTTRFL